MAIRKVSGGVIYTEPIEVGAKNMEELEFIQKAQKIGISDEYIASIIKIHNELRAEGLDGDLCWSLIKPPMGYPSEQEINSDV